MALEWVFNYGKELNIDSKRIAVSGDSAGANLATSVCIRSRNECGPKILLQLLLVPYIDLAMSTESVKTIKVLPANSYPYLEWINQLYIPKGFNPKDPRISPFWETHLENLPKAVVVTTQYDSHHDQGYLYAQKLKEAGNEVIYKNYEGMIHIFLNMESILPEAKEANYELTNYIRQVFEE
jgi:acetyl esterase